MKWRGEEITGMNERELGRISRRFGVLFQSGALLQSMTVGENVALPILEHSSVDEGIAELMVKMKLELVGLTGFEDLKPAEISGGMKKRVALARALALDPEMLFSDEPTSGLDPVMTAVVDKLAETPSEAAHAFRAVRATLRGRPGGSPALLAATAPETAADLLWSCLAESGGSDAEVQWITNAQNWALPVALGAGLSLSPAGPICVRGELGPLTPYLPSGPFL